MPITFACGCGRQLQVGDEYAGKKARCPECNAVLDVPFSDAPPPLPTAAKPPLARPSRRVEPEVTADDHGGTAGSLDPFEKRNRSSKRPRRDEEDEEEDRPRNRRRDRDEDDEEDRPRRRRRRYEDDEDDIRPRRRNEPPPHKLMNNQVVGGIICVVLATVVFAISLYFEVVCLRWLIILVIVGIIGIVRGLISGQDE